MIAESFALGCGHVIDEMTDSAEYTLFAPDLILGPAASWSRCRKLEVKFPQTQQDPHA